MLGTTSCTGSGPSRSGLGTRLSGWDGSALLRADALDVFRFNTNYVGTKPAGNRVGLPIKGKTWLFELRLGISLVIATIVP